MVLDANWRIFLRPVKPNDDQLIRDLFAHVSKEDLRLRFFDSIKEIAPALMNKLTHLDYSRAMAFIAIDDTEGHTLGVVRLHANETGETAEFAIVIRSDLKGRGLGWLLMQLIIEYAKSQKLKGLHGEILQENAVMLKMCRDLGFQIKTNAPDCGLRNVQLSLRDRQNG